MPRLLLPDAQTLADLATYLGRARRADPAGSARLVASAGVLAVYVSPVHGGDGPTVLGLRVVRVVGPDPIDVTCGLAALTPLLDGVRPSGPAPLPGPALDLPPGQPAGGWEGVSPPRTGWRRLATVRSTVLTAACASGVAEIAAGAAPEAGALAVARLRGLVWGRPLPDVDVDPDVEGDVDEDRTPVPAGVAFAADALGFVEADAQYQLWRTGPWVRLTTPRGHVIARSSPRGGLGVSAPRRPTG